MTNILNEAVTMDDLTADEEFITAAQFEDATRTVVRTLGKNFDLDIIFAGDGAKTDGGTVILPAQDPTKLMTKKQYAVGQGFANHETMHNLCTDMPMFTKELKRLKGEGKKLAMSCANAIEDVRIEKAAGTLYPGIPSQISSTADYAAKMFLDEYLAKDPEIMKDFKRIGPLAITWRGRQRLGYNAPYIQKCLDLIEPEMLEKLDKWCDLIDTLPTGADSPGNFDQSSSHAGSHKAVQYAEMLAKEIEDLDEEEEDQDGDGDGQGDGQNQSGGGATSNHQTGNGNQQSGGNSQNHGGQGNGQVKNHQQAGTLDEQDPIDPDMDKAVFDLMAQGQTGTGWRPVSTALDVWVTKDVDKARGYRGCDSLSDPNNLPMYQKLKSEIGSKTAVMKRKLERALLTASEADYVSGMRSGKLDVRRRGINIMQGRENVYRKKVDGQEVDTAVTILVDASGSMGGNSMYLASQVCVALAECLERTPVEIEILAFRGDHPHGLVDDKIIQKVQEITRAVSNARDQGDKRAGLFHRASPVMMFELKRFDQSLRDAVTSLGAMPAIADGGTPDGDAILKAASRLMQNKRKKKIMMVLTDGSPGYSCINGRPTDFTKMAINYCTKKLGINMVGVGIYTDHVQHLYKNWSAIHDIGDLDKAVIDNIARLILGEDFKVDNGDVSGAAQNYKRRA